LFGADFYPPATGVIGGPAVAMRNLVAAHRGQHMGIFLARWQSDVAHAFDHRSAAFGWATA